MSTDRQWERWGAEDPYFGVITHAQFRRDALDDDAKREFFETGAAHVRRVLEVCAGYGVAPRRTLDFGCGVGRLAIPFAAHNAQVVGLDVSPSMLEEARRNAAAMGVENVAFLESDDDLSAVEGPFDLVHSFIVLQHIPTDRGIRLFRRLVELLGEGGVGALHLTYGKKFYVEGLGRPTPRGRAVAKVRMTLRTILSAVGVLRDPQMQMNAYDVNALLYILQTEGVRDLQVQFEDHGGELGVFLFFRKPTAEG